MQDIYDSQGLPTAIADKFVANKLAEAQTIAKKLAKKEPEIGTNIAQYKEALAQWQQTMNEAQANVAFWQEVSRLASERNLPNEETTPTNEETAPQTETPEVEETAPETEEVAEETTTEETETETPQVEQQPQDVAETAEKIPSEQQPTAESEEETPTEFHITDNVAANSTEAQQLATEAVMMVLTENGLEPIIATDAMAEAVLGNKASDVELQAINDKFNSELQQQIDGTLSQGHIYQLGMPGNVLLATGIANVPIQLNSQRLLDKSSNFGHDYELSELKDLVKAINNPIAIFAYGDKSKAQNIAIEIQHEGKNFIVGLSIRPIVGGQVLDINSIRNVFPKDNAEWLNWIAQDKALYLDKKRVQDLIDQQQTNLADVEYLNLNSITNIVQNSPNPIIEAHIFGGNSGYVGYSMSKRAAEAREEGRYPKTDFKKNYHIPQSTLDALVEIGLIDNTEWHHTSMYGNRTTFYGWGEPWYGDAYAENKKEVDRLVKEQPINAEAIESLFNKAKDAYENAQRVAQAEYELRRAYWDFDKANQLSNLPEEYTASNGVVLVSNGNTNPYRWDGFYNGNKAWKKWREKAAEELRNILEEKNKSNPTYEQWRATNQDLISETYAKYNATPIEFLRTPQGTVYGWTDGKQIYLTQDGLNPETPIHEYTHLWARAMMQQNAEGWQSVKDLLRDTPTWFEVVNDVNYTDIQGNEDAIASEVLSRLSGKNGAQKLTDMAQQLINEGNPQAQTLIGRIRKALQEFWSWVGTNLFDIKEFESIEQVSDRVLWDMVQGTDLGNLEVGPAERMIIGEQGAIELDRAEEATHRMDNLAIAREMETAGKDAKTIRLATGWERGADGKWRYEIEDIKSIDIDGNLIFERNHPDRVRYLELLKKRNSYALLGTEPLTETELNEYSELSDMWGGLSGKLDNVHTLEAYVDAPELYEAYPQTRYIQLEFTDYLPKDVGGRLVTTGGEIFDYEDTVKPVKIYVSNNFKYNQSMVESILVHEIQHAIQYYEGFAKGGNTQSVKTRKDELKADASRLYEMMLETPEWGEYVRLIDRWVDLDDTSVEPRIDEINQSGVLDAIRQEQKRLRKKYGNDANVGKILNQPYAMDAGIWNHLPEGFDDRYDAYHRLAGEVESRNAQARINMTPEQRRATLLAETEDVAREDQIFLMENTGASAMAVGEIDDFVSLMKSNAKVAPFVEITEDNWVDKIQTPIGEVKMGENQKDKLFTNGRERQYGMLLETLSNPDLILEESDAINDPTHERSTSYLFIKTFQKEDGSKYVHFESVTVSIDGLEISISSHIIRENQLKNKMKSDKLLYKATALDKSANSSAEQSIEGGSLSSTDKDTTTSSNTQEDGELLRPESNAQPQENISIDTRTAVAQQTADALGVEIEIDENIPAKGSYNPSTGRVRINPSRHATAEDVQRTVLHEVIGHGGLQAVVGERFNEVCAKAYDMMSEEQRADIRSRHGNRSNEAIGAEYMAEMAEKGNFDVTTWEKIKAMVRQLFIGLGQCGHETCVIYHYLIECNISYRLMAHQV